MKMAYLKWCGEHADFKDNVAAKIFSSSGVPDSLGGSHLQAQISHRLNRMAESRKVRMMKRLGIVGPQRNAYIKAGGQNEEVSDVCIHNIDVHYFIDRLSPDLKYNMFPFTNSQSKVTNEANSFIPDFKCDLTNVLVDIHRWIPTGG